MISKNAVLLIACLLGVGSYFLLRTPVYGETQLINKIYLMILMCYFLCAQYGLILRVSRKESSVLEIGRYYAFFVSTATVILMLINRGFDGFMGLIGYEIHSGVCFGLSVLFVFATGVVVKSLTAVK